MRDVNFEARRVAVAFRLNRCRSIHGSNNTFQYRGNLSEHTMTWYYLRETGQLIIIRIGDQAERCVVHRFSGGVVLEHWRYVPHPWFDEQMARGLYCLGFEQESVFPQLNYSLTAHEKLELRLSMPHKFWPQNWLDEERKHIDIDWEAQRVAVAFGATTFERTNRHVENRTEFAAMIGDRLLEWQLDQSGQLRHIALGNSEATQDVQLFFDRWPTNQHEGMWVVRPHANYNEQMVRGLFRLGITTEDGGELALLNYSLTAHEKLELRLSMPHQFWPQNWLDEEAT